MNSSLGEFRFWCQKVLPLVYDDSLSYYEVLCKLRDIVNRIIQELEAANNRIDDVYKVMQGIQEQINNILINIDTISRDEVIKILNEWLADGTMEKLVQKTVSALLHVKVSSFVNVAAMQAGDLDNGDFAMTASYVSNNLGGGFYLITSTPDYTQSGWFIKLANGNYALLISESPNIHQFNYDSANSNQSFKDAISYCATFNRSSLDLNGQILTLTISEIYLQSNFKVFNGRINIPVDNYTYLFRGEAANNLTFENLYFQQGITYDGAYHGKFTVNDLIHASTIFFFHNCENISFHNCTFNQNNTGYFILPDTVVNLRVTNTTFKNMSYAGVYLFGACKNAYFENCIFDTNINTTASNCYLLGTGNDNDTYYANKYVDGFTVKNCQFLNNPRWEGLETHGASNVIFDGNIIKNCLTGIMCASDVRSFTVPMSNILIANNFIELNPTDKVYPYMSVRGNEKSPMSNVTIRDNIMTGLETPYSTYAGLMNLSYMDGLSVSGNMARNTTVNNALSLLILSNFQILNNSFSFNMPTQGIHLFGSNALMNGYFDGNKIQITNNRTVSNIRLITFNNTLITNVYFSANNVFPSYYWQRSVQGWDTYGYKGTLIMDSNWKPSKIATNDFNVGGPVDAGTALITAGSNEVTFTDFFYQHISVGSFITIGGGASGGADLFTYVKGWKDRYTVYVDPAPSASITAAKITNGVPTFVDYFPTTPA